MSITNDQARALSADLPGAASRAEARAWPWVVGVWCAAFGYAAVRYVGVGPVAATELPLYIFNKGLSFAALTLFALTYISPSKARSRAMGQAGTWMVFMHAALSTLLFATGYFESFFTASGALRLRVQLGLLVGVTAVVALMWQRAHPRDRHVRAVRKAIVAGAGLHVAMLGAPGWLEPSKWHGALPPITLLAAAIVVGLVVGVWSRGRSLR